MIRGFFYKNSKEAYVLLVEEAVKESLFKLTSSYQLSKNKVLGQRRGDLFLLTLFKLVEKVDKDVISDSVSKILDCEDDPVVVSRKIYKEVMSSKEKKNGRESYNDRVFWYVLALDIFRLRILCLYNYGISKNNDNGHHDKSVRQSKSICRDSADIGARSLLGSLMAASEEKKEDDLLLDRSIKTSGVSTSLNAAGV